jgi:hypothetical protein
VALTLEETRLACLVPVPPVELNQDGIPSAAELHASNPRLEISDSSQSAGRCRPGRPGSGSPGRTHGEPCQPFDISTYHPVAPRSAAYICLFHLFEYLENTTQGFFSSILDVFPLSGVVVALLGRPFPSALERKPVTCREEFTHPQV